MKVSWQKFIEYSDRYREAWKTDEKGFTAEREIKFDERSGSLRIADGTYHDFMPQSIYIQADEIDTLIEHLTKMKEMLRERQ